MKSDVLIRPSAASDLEAITRIYREHVLEGTGVPKNVGTKFDSWLDVVVMQLEL